MLNDLLKRQTDLEKMKATYEREPGKWVVYMFLSSFKWLKARTPAWNNGETYKLIRKEHEKIWDAVIANPDVEVEVNFKVDQTVENYDKYVKNYKGFFEDYNPCFEYQLAPTETKQDFNGGYIVASQEAYDLLVKVGNTANTKYPNQRFKPNTLTVRDGWIGQSEADINSGQFSDLKQFYINNHKLTWEDEPVELKDEQC